MGQERGRISAFNHLCGIFKGGFRVAVFPEYIRRFLSHFLHLCQVAVRAFQPAGNHHLPFSAPAHHEIFGISGGFPLYFQFFTGIHHLPGGAAHHHQQIIEGTCIKTGLFKTLFI
ncbi:hypothetical protein FQZ97_1123680 [compost metagenome]